MVIFHYHNQIPNSPIIILSIVLVSCDIVEKLNLCYLIPSFNLSSVDLVIIPGSRLAHTYLVKVLSFLTRVV